MKTEEFFEVLGEIDDDIVKDAQSLIKKNTNGKVRKISWVKWGAIAACLCLAISGAAAAHQSGMFRAPAHPADADADGNNTITPAIEDDAINDYAAEVAYGFYLDGNNLTVYFPISFDERRHYGLVPYGAVGLTKDNIYQITEDDLGDLMGTATDCGDEAINGSKVYHFAKYPDKDSICVVDTPHGYEFYTCTWLNFSVEIGGTSDVVLAAYGLPDSLEKMEILAPDFQHLSDMDDKPLIKAIFEILSGKINSGREANERRFAQAWYDAYGSDDVYYSEEDGHCVYRFVSEDPITYTTYTDSEGNTSVQWNSEDISLYDKAHELWTEGECILQITTNRGYQLTIDYFPTIRTFICGGGYYELSTDEADSLSLLLQN